MRGAGFKGHGGTVCILSRVDKDLIPSGVWDARVPRRYAHSDNAVTLVPRARTLTKNGHPIVP